MDKALINKRVLEAINYIITHFKITKTALADVFDVKPAKFSEILKERMNAGVEIMAILCNTYNISAEWLLTGEGSMLKIDSPPEPSENNTETPTEGSIDTPLVAQLRAIIQEQARQIAHLEIELANERASVAANQMSTLSGES